MKSYYATVSGNSVTEDIYEGGILRHKANSCAYYDLFKFSTVKERDDFVNEAADRAPITVAEIKKDSHLRQQY